MREWVIQPIYDDLGMVYGIVLGGVPIHNLVVLRVFFFLLRHATFGVG